MIPLKGFRLRRQNIRRVPHTPPRSDCNEFLAAHSGEDGQLDSARSGVVPMRCLNMSLRLLGVGFALLAAAAPVRADFLTVSTASIPLTQTNWTPTTSSLAGVNPFQV